MWTWIGGAAAVRHNVAKVVATGFRFGGHHHKECRALVDLVTDHQFPSVARDDLAVEPDRYAGVGEELGHPLNVFASLAVPVADKRVTLHPRRATCDL